MLIARIGCVQTRKSAHTENSIRSIAMQVTIRKGQTLTVTYPYEKGGARCLVVEAAEGEINSIFNGPASGAKIAARTHSGAAGWLRVSLAAEERRENAGSSGEMKRCLEALAKASELLLRRSGNDPFGYVAQRCAKGELQGDSIPEEFANLAEAVLNDLVGYEHHEEMHKCIKKSCEAIVTARHSTEKVSK